MNSRIATNGPKLTRRQASKLLAKLKRMYDHDRYVSPRAFRVLHAYQLTVGENIHTKGERQFLISGPTKKAKELNRLTNRYKIVAVVPCRAGFRAILSLIELDPACYI